MPDLRLEGDDRKLAAIAAVRELLMSLGTRGAFVGEVAAAAWLGEPLARGGAIDVLAALGGDGARQIPQLAPQEGFRVDEDEVDRARELDLLPMWWTDGDEPVRVHVLLASNALYGRMVRESVEAATPRGNVQIVAAEDLALLMLVAEPPGWEAEIARIRLRAGETFDRDRLNRKLASIGLGGKALA